MKIRVPEIDLNLDEDMEGLPVKAAKILGIDPPGYSQLGD